MLSFESFPSGALFFGSPRRLESRFLKSFVVVLDKRGFEKKKVKTFLQAVWTGDSHELD